MGKLGIRISKIWYNGIKKIIFKDVYLEIEKKNTQIFQITNLANKLIISQNNLKKNILQVDNLVALTSNNLKKNISQVKKLIVLTPNNLKKIDRFFEISDEQNKKYLKQNKIEKLEYIKQSQNQNNQHLIQNKHILRESLDKIIVQYKKENENYIEKIYLINDQNKKDYSDWLVKTKKILSEEFVKNKNLHKELLNKFLFEYNIKTENFLTCLTNHTNKKKCGTIRANHKNN